MTESSIVDYILLKIKIYICKNIKRPHLIANLIPIY